MFRPSPGAGRIVHGVGSAFLNRCPLPTKLDRLERPQGSGTGEGTRRTAVLVAPAHSGRHPPSEYAGQSSVRDGMSGPNENVVSNQVKPHTARRRNVGIYCRVSRPRSKLKPTASTLGYQSNNNAWPGGIGAIAPNQTGLIKASPARPPPVPRPHPRLPANWHAASAHHGKRAPPSSTLVCPACSPPHVVTAAATFPFRALSDAGCPGAPRAQTL